METVFGLEEICEAIPHRYPFLFIDRIVEFEDNKRAVGLKNVTFNEPYFQGHFPGKPVMPGVLIMEAMAQTSAILAKKSSNGCAPEKTIFLVGGDNFRWKKMVTPGDTLRIEVTFVKRKGPLWITDNVVTVDGQLVGKGTLSAIEG